jgi:S-adenosylmethionine-diacylglycerol 3-amino-3-carboxypropyl transferase
MSADNYHHLLTRLCRVSSSGGRLAYWNMLVPRRRPAVMADQLRPLTDLAQTLHRQDKAFFYSDFIIEEVV